MQQKMIQPDATATICGANDYPNLRGQIRSYQRCNCVLVEATIRGLPVTDTGFFGFHIHEGESCAGNEEDIFAGARTHYNPQKCPHPRHAGDLPPLFGNEGYAFSVFLTDRFTVDEIVGKTVIIHASPDDFKTQPAGNAGEKIACGIIKER